LLDGYRTRLTGMTPVEAEALFLSGLPGPAAELGLGDAMAAAQLKLLAALPTERRDGAGRVAARFHLDPVGWYQNAERADTLPLLADAVWNTKRIRICYESWKATVERDLDPLGLALKAGVWYLVARAGGKPRTYRVSNILKLEVTEDAFTRPRDFDLAAYWGEWIKDFEARLYKGKATLRLSPEGMKRLALLAPPVQEMAKRTAGKPDKNGWVRVEIPIESVTHAVGDVLRLGVHAEALAPPDLRKRMAEIGAEMRALYRR
jgi:predicted DNA-binding transcriptional regulator YafY